MIASRIAVGALCAVLTALCTKAQDPLQEIPAAAPPAFRQLVPEKDYRQRQEKAVAELGDVNILAKSDMPAVGALITRVLPESQAATLRLASGDIITRIDEKPALWRDLPRDRKQAATLHFYQAATATMKSVEVEPGRLGVFLEDHWRPELLYLRGQQRDPKWERHVLLGITRRGAEGDLAETAWHHAVAAGYVADYLSAQCGAEIALGQGRTPEAYQFALAAKAAVKSPSELVSPLVIYRAALANYQLRTAQELARQFPETVGAKPEVLQRLVELHAARGAVQRNLPPPSEMAASRYRDNLLPRLAPRERKRHQQLFADLQTDGRLKFEPATDHFQQRILISQEALRDVELTLRFRARLTDDQKGSYQKCVVFGVYPVSKQRDDEEDLDPFHVRRGLLELQVDDDFTVRLQHSEADARLAYQAGGKKLDGRREHELRLLCISGRGEIFLDGSRLAYVPVDDKSRKLAFLIKAVGMSLSVRNVQITELIEKKE